jgi:copper(I)-binding protein
LRRLGHWRRARLKIPAISVERSRRPPDDCNYFSQSKDTVMIPNLRLVTSVALLSTLLLAPAEAGDAKAGDLVISQAWSRATPGGAKVAGGYLTIDNKGTSPDRLLGGTSSVAGKVEVHEMSMADGVMTMRPLDKGLPVEPGKSVKLAPGGYHLMLMDLKTPLKQGEGVAVTLEFEKAGKVEVSLDVQGVGAGAPGGAAAEHKGHSGMMK